MKKNYIKLLPYDIYNIIYNYLAIVDIFNLSTTDKQKNNVVKQSWIYKHYMNHFKSIQCGNQFSMILKNNKLYNMGCNYNKQLGLPKDFYHKPQYFINNVLTVSCGANHSLILTSHGLYGLGSNSHEQIAAFDSINYDTLQPIP